MFILRVSYLTGRVFASDFDDGDLKTRIEWPPHPSRLFSALVAAWGEGGAEEELKPALRWIEQQKHPAVYADSCDSRLLVQASVPVQAFVPVNDSQLPPDSRPRKPRRFPSAALRNPDVYFVWESTPTSEIKSGLDAILNRTSSVGHSSSLVAVEIADSLPENVPPPWLHGAEERPRRLRVPHPGRLQELIDRHKDFTENPVKTNRPSKGRSVLYGRPRETKDTVQRGLFDRMIIFRRVEGTRCGLRSTLSLLGALRSAILANSPQPVPEYLSGHAPESTSKNPICSTNPHVALVPLAFVSTTHATGELLGAAMLLPSTLTENERRICWDVAARIEQLKTSWGTWTIELADTEESRFNLHQGAWSRPAKILSTVTPFVFDRYPDDPYGEEAEKIVRNAFPRVGSPEPTKIDLHYNPWHTGVPKASAFAPAAARPGKPRRYHCHVRIEFPEAVAGPVVAGAGRFYGYGFFRPHPERERE